MNKDYRYILEKGSKKHICPDCGKKSFVRYFDIETKEYLPEKYGRCDRESNCTYHLNPYSDSYGTNEQKQYEYKPKPKPQTQPVYFIPEDILNATLKDYEKNIFIQNLLKLAPVEDIEKVISMYRLGTIGKGEREGAVTFPFIDRAGNIREIQVKQFDETNHSKPKPCTITYLFKNHYSKQAEAFPGWLQDFTKNEKQYSCLFGEHLLHKYPLNPVALVEAPKTAIIGTLYYGLPETPGALLWLAVYNKSSLTIDKCKALQGRKVVLFPDLNAYNDWNTKTQELKIKLPGTRFVCSDILEREATETERTGGLDLADYLTKFDYKLFRKQPEQITPQKEQSTPQASIYSHSKPIEQPEPIPEQLPESENGEKNENETKHYFYQKLNLFNTQPENWNKEIDLLEAFFTGTRLPEAPVKLSQGETITDIDKFIHSHLTTLKRYNGNPTFKPFLHRLQQLMNNN